MFPSTLMAAAPTSSQGFLAEIGAGRGQISIWNLLVIVGLIGVAILCRFAVGRRDAGRGAYQPRKLFVALCRAHQLDQAEARLLALVAKSQQLDQPALIFLRPDLLTIQQLDAQFCAHHSQIQALRKRLFGDAATTT